MPFETDQKSEPHTFITPQNDTDFKAVISYLFRSRLLILQARTITVITWVYTILVLRRPKMAISNAR